MASTANANAIAAPMPTHSPIINNTPMSVGMYILL